MSNTNPKFYLTTPIYYVNARPHIGHAYTTIVADVIARRHRLLGDDTFFLTGTDEHGQKIERSAAAAGIPPQQFADQVSAQFESLWKRMGITNNDFIRTTDDRHKRGVQKLFTTLKDNGAIYLDTYTGQYCISDEAYVDGPPGVICPDCGNFTETVSESNYYFKLSEYQVKLIDLIESNQLLIQPESRRNEVLSFLRGNLVSTAGMMLVGYPGPLEQGLNLAEINEGLSNGKLRRSEAGSLYVPGALKDLSISRTSFKWGIPVPGDESHVIYVWLDALANYMTALGYGSDDPADIARFERYWPADLHLVGKEIIRFHCVYWPAFLMAANLPLPKAITAHGWLLFEESKMSKSRGNIVRTETILDAFGTLKPKPIDLPGAVLSDEYWKHEQDLFAADVLRYFLLREIPFGQDGSFSFDALWQRYNSDLANGYGNLVSRTLKMISQYFDGSVSPLLHEVSYNSYTAAENAAVYASIAFSPEKLANIQRLIESVDFTATLASIQTLIKWTDDILSVEKPWKERDTSEDTKYIRTQVLYQAAESIRIITALLYPILPYATAKVWAQLGLGDIEEAARNGKLKDLKWGGLQPGTKLGELAPIFPRADKGLIQIMNDMEQNTSPQKPDQPAGLPHVNTDLDAAPPTHTEFIETPISSVSATPELNPIAESVHPIAAHHAEPIAAPAAPGTPQIAIDDFVKIDLRVARIIVAERIPKADKLLRLEVDLGYETRQILSGIAEWYTPEELIGRRIVVIANLAPRKMRGLESHGMLLAASSGENGKPILATFAEDIALGSRLR
jgi:methionyl-tRNA synthetase